MASRQPDRDPCARSCCGASIRQSGSRIRLALREAFVTFFAGAFGARLTPALTSPSPARSASRGSGTFDSMKAARSLAFGSSLLSPRARIDSIGELLPLYGSNSNSADEFTMVHTKRSEAVGKGQRRGAGGGSPSEERRCTRSGSGWNGRQASRDRRCIASCEGQAAVHARPWRFGPAVGELVRWPAAASLSDAVDAVGAVDDRRGQIGEHRSRRIRPRPPIRVRQRGRDLRRQPGQVRQLAEHPNPACDTTPCPSADTLKTSNRCDTLFTCKVPSCQAS